MDEFSFINAIKQNYYKQSSLIKGIGDDAAVFTQTSKGIVTAVDTFVEHVHFSKETMSPFHVGYRTLAANISDLAAMGATPAFYLVSIVVPPTWADEDLKDIFQGMNSLAHKHHLDLIGGDTVSGSELVITITVIGYVPKDKVRYRHTAQAEDIVFVTGTLGDSQAGLHILQDKGQYIDEDYFIKRHRMPEPKVNFAKRLRHISRVTLNDISDGLANEASEIAEASRVNIVLKDDLIPLRSSLSQFSMSLQHKWAYFGGEDFELLGTVARKNWDQVKVIAKQTNTSVTEIGYIEECPVTLGQVYLMKDHKKQRLHKKGYTHLK